MVVFIYASLFGNGRGEKSSKLLKAKRLVRKRDFRLESC